MDKTKVIFLGSRPLGHYALKFLCEMENIDVLGVVVREQKNNKWWDLDPIDIANKNGLRIYKHEELHGLDFDLGISINYWKIIENEIMSIPKFGFINVHHSHNLYLRGRGMASRAILESNSIPYHGTCIHYTDDGLDTGPILESISFEIEEDDTAWTLNYKADSYAKLLIKKWFPRLVKGIYPSIKPNLNNPLLLNDDLQDLKLINMDNPNKEFIKRQIKAFDFCGIFEPAYYINDDNEKIHLVKTKIKNSDKVIIDNEEFYILRK